MAEDLLNTVRDVVEGQIDFVGQQRVEQLTTYSLSVIGVVSFIAGYVTQNISYTLIGGLGATTLVFLALVPAWPMFNKNPERWLPSQRDLSNLNISISS